MRVFVTVGSTKFDALVQKVLTDEVLSALKKRGYSEIVVQCGNSFFAGHDSVGDVEHVVQRGSVTVTIWKFKPSLEEEYEKADLVISHAGSGTILDVLRRGKPMIVVPNPTLLHNHQQELADALADQGHLKASNVHGLAQAIEEFETSALVPFPQFDGTRFAKILDETMGFT
ncbi:glycosyltransferase 28 [Coprinopsis cinerea okayama7|uniref:UDP-N-acetylglucosamine transferase subunit ALG13 n=1 Tax=Coprinopsis cinerea (strain Okayama-7 / 130 / ATCC MYA-4618 / FGSC 9003) TaxID=240176 RepID=A8NH80_COPC7|nr:glycosyltransferase 28 [Coprinopsis cinerea okayama7\|eukprot:XP_001833706.1 glycosyltransferase 28 [Coprinopsis cinerea okayama7\